MSSLPWPVASRWARRLAETIIEEAERVAIVGSIRRKREEVGDIELLVEPVMRTQQGDLFTQGARPDIQAVVDALLSEDRDRAVLKGGDRYVKMRLAGEGRREDHTTMDLFFCHPPASWGALKVIRTGPSDLGRILVTMLREKGWRQHKGAVWCPAHKVPPPFAGGSEPNTQIDGRAFVRIPTPEEEDVFEAVGLEYVPPERRDDLAENLQQRRTG